MIMINANDTVYEITKAHPEVVEIMVELGFSDVLRPGMVHNVGRSVSLAKGAKLRNIEWDVIQKAFEEKGFALSEITEE